jgi:UDP:flavonoid glycosyltransferase YjiC (YdhE family)
VKRRLIFFPFDLFSHYLRCLPLADAVRNDFDIHFTASRHEGANQRVRGAGYSLVACQSIDAERMSVLESRLDHSWMRQEELEPIFLDQVRVLRELKPDLVISDFSITLPMAAELTHTPCVTLMVGHLSQHYRFARPGPAAHPGIKWLRRLHCPRPLETALTTLGEKVEFRIMHRGVRAIRKKHQLRSRAHYLDEIEGDHNLITDVEDFSPMNNLPGNFTYIGPIFHRDPTPESDVLERLDPGKKTVLITLGTFWKSDELYTLFNDPAFRSYNVVLAGKPGVSMAPPVVVKPFINLEALLPRTDLVICHGGDATVYQCVAHGTPLLGLPFQGEQTWSLERVARLGLGEALRFPLPVHQLLGKIRYWIDRKRIEGERYQRFSQKISLESTQRRFRETLLHLNERTHCGLCRGGTYEGSREIANVPSDVRRYANEFFTVWRCGACAAIHSLRTMDLTDYYADYPYDQIGSNPFIQRAVGNLSRLLRRYGIKKNARLLLSAPFVGVHAEILRREGFESITVLPRQKPGEPPPVLPLGAYDAVVFLGTLEDIDHPGALLRQTATSLAPEGRVFLQCPDAGRIDLSRVNAHRHDLHQPYHLHVFSKIILFRLAREAGLELVDLQWRHFWDTLFPFVNIRTVHSLSRMTDRSLDSTIVLSEIKFRRWWHWPALLFNGFFGGLFRKNVWMWAVFERPKPP